ncbi:uncharacterized protein BX663DRAFT_485323 [Cokeromyces recurvatus]|uniref:uncharacterized protein n=1 Tax=Cokeromyces recurvatus TaxID=90255 RepID=UPI00221F7C89|nr:uncharacterized protein BX663DRAFT_485323 [Cokeromyces recurvatus]KAI7903814.1 hypothetical protein BX663DRAFT_485323 [Cokeromyces recurvatus]
MSSVKCSNRQPYTIFTFANCDNTKSFSDGRVMSLVFREIALSIVRQQDNGVADDVIVGSLEKTFLEMMLNSHLEKLAGLLCPDLCRVNSYVSDAIIQAFPSD